MIRTFTLILPLIATMLILTTGCWDRRELNNLAIASGIGIETKDGSYTVTAQIENAGEIAKKSGSGSGAPIATFQSSGETIFEALSKMSKVSPREVYVNHLRIVVLSEQLAKNGIGEAMEFFSRHPDFRSDFNIFIAKNTEVTNILNTLTQIEKIPSNSIFSSIRSSSRIWGEFQEISIDKLISNLESDTTGAVLPGLSFSGDKQMAKNINNIQNSQSPAHIKLQGMAVFKKDRLIGWLNETESIGFNFAQNKIKETVVHVLFGDKGKMAVDVYYAKANITGWIDNNKLHCKINLYTEGKIEELISPIDVSKYQTILSLEKETENQIKKYISSAVTTSQHKLKSDIFGFGEAINRSSPKKWEAMKRQWDERFEDLTVQITVKTKLRSSGQTNCIC